MSFLLWAGLSFWGVAAITWTRLRLRLFWILRLRWLLRRFSTNVNKTVPFKCHVEFSWAEFLGPEREARKATTARQPTNLPLSRWATRPSRKNHPPSHTTTQILLTAIAADVHRCSRIITTKYVSGNINAKLKATTTMTSTMAMRTRMRMAGCDFTTASSFAFKLPVDITGNR